MSPVLRAGIDTLPFMRMTSTSNRACLKTPRFEAIPAVRNETSNAEIDRRTFSAACRGCVTNNHPTIRINDRLMLLLSLKAELRPFTLEFWKFDKGDCF